MKSIQKLELVSQPFSVVRSWRRWVGRVESLYRFRVHRPVYLWRAQGSRCEFLPRLPWWHPFVYRFLRLVGRLRRRQRFGAVSVVRFRCSSRRSCLRPYPEFVFVLVRGSSSGCVQVEWELPGRAASLARHFRFVFSNGRQRHHLFGRFSLHSYDRRIYFFHILGQYFTLNIFSAIHTWVLSEPLRLKFGSSPCNLNSSVIRISRGQSNGHRGVNRYTLL